MATTNLGRIAFVPQGDWIAGTYKYLDVVRYGHNSYFCALTSGTSATPGTNSDWQILAQDATGLEASSLQTTGESVTVNAASPPTTGQALVATSTTTATWQTVAPPDFLIMAQGVI
jgi:hypothetical protein